jgi:hypothetical protein
MSRDYSPSNSASTVFRVKIDIPRLRPNTAAKLRAELDRLAKSNSPCVQRFVAGMRERYPGMVR